jgi:hypothetical protein
VGLVVYVRNDPVNYIDPDGRDPEPFTIRITSSAPAYPREDGGADSLNDLNKMWILGLIKTGAEMDLPSFDVETTMEGGDIFLSPLRSELEQRIKDRGESCQNFLEGVIGRLGLKMSVGQLLDKIDGAVKEEGVTDLNKGVYEQVKGNTIRISGEGMEPHTFDWGSGKYRYLGDKLSLYLHAAFHLESTSPGKTISDSALYNAAAPLVRLSMRGVLFEEQKSAIVGAAFATACGSGQTIQPVRRR